MECSDLDTVGVTGSNPVSRTIFLGDFRLNPQDISTIQDIWAHGCSISEVWKAHKTQQQLVDVSLAQAITEYIEHLTAGVTSRKSDGCYGNTKPPCHRICRSNCTPLVLGGKQSKTGAICLLKNPVCAPSTPGRTGADTSPNRLNLMPSKRLHRRPSESSQTMRSHRC